MFFLLLIPLVFGAKLPSNFPKCHQNQVDFNQCLTKAIEKSIHEMTEPFKDLNVPSLEPLVIPSLTIAAGSQTVALQQNYKNMNVTGLTKITCQQAKLNFTNGTFIMDCTVPKVIMEFDYDFNGTILVFPLYGKGPGSITLENVNYILSFVFKKYNKNGDDHFQIINHNLEIIPKLVRFKLDNLFNGDAILGDNINQVLNDNWKEILDDIKVNYEDAFGKIFTSIFDNLLTKISIKNLFN